MSTTIWMLWINKLYHIVLGGMLWCSLFRLWARRSRVWLLMLSLEFFKTWSFWPHCGCGVDSASNRNEYKVYFLGGKAGRYVGLTTLPPSHADCFEIWETQPPGTLQACTGLLYLYYSPCSMSMQHKHVEMGVRQLMSTTGSQII